MQLRSIIIDDEEDGIESLRRIIEKHIPDVNVVAHAARADESIQLVKNYKPEIIFLDISMPEMDGFELLEKMEWKGFHLIFITAHQEFALKAIKNEAIDYLLKPVDHLDLRQAIDRIKERINEQQQTISTMDYSLLNSVNPFHIDKLGVTSKKGIEYLDPLEIITLESKSNYTLITMSNNKSILTPKTLGEFEEQLCDFNLNFMRVHNSFVVNLNKMLRYLKEKDTIVMVNEQKVPLSRSRRDVFFKWLNGLSS